LRSNRRAAGALSPHVIAWQACCAIKALPSDAGHDDMLAVRQASLEEAFRELTRDAADYQPHQPAAGKTAPA
jgi:hypothetical protein